MDSRWDDRVREILISARAPLIFPSAARCRTLFAIRYIAACARSRMVRAIILTVLDGEFT